MIEGLELIEKLELELAEYYLRFVKYFINVKTLEEVQVGQTRCISDRYYKYLSNPKNVLFISLYDSRFNLTIKKKYLVFLGSFIHYKNGSIYFLNERSFKEDEIWDEEFAFDTYEFWTEKLHHEIDVRKDFLSESHYS